MKGVTKFKEGELLVYITDKNPILPWLTDRLVQVMSYTRIYSDSYSAVPVRWLDQATTSKSKSYSWYMCPLTRLRRPTKKELLTWYVEQL